MIDFSIIEGRNFSGRSRLLGDMLLAGPESLHRHFLGPHAECGLSGFASTVRDELQLHDKLHCLSDSPWGIALGGKLTQAVSALSGGEQTMLGLTCMPAAAGAAHVGIDCALEQLDRRNRAIAFGALLALPAQSSVTLVDHRLSHAPSPNARHLSADGKQNVDETTFDLSIVEAVVASDWRVAAPTIVLEDLHFAYRDRQPVFTACSTSLTPGTVYRLAGDNGSGKTTLVKLLCGVLAPQQGGIRLDRHLYQPHHVGNTLIAYATQNPDEQWTSTTLSTDFAVRSARIPSTLKPPRDEPSRLARLAGHMGIDLTRERHLLDYPRALRKRLSWLWALCGFMPWLALDEPTLGQDNETTSQLATALAAMASRGYGVVVISHDDRLWSRVEHRVLRLAEGQVDLME